MSKEEYWAHMLDPTQVARQKELRDAEAEVAKKMKFYSSLPSAFKDKDGTKFSRIVSRLQMFHHQQRNKQQRI